MFSFVNFIWIAFGGGILAIIWLILTAICCLTIVGIPLGRIFFQFAKLSISPYGKDLVRETELIDQQNVSIFKKAGEIILKAIWFPMGIFLAAIYLGLGILSSIAAVSKPIADVYLKMGKMVLAPVGVKVVTRASITNKQKSWQALK